MRRSIGLAVIVWLGCFAMAQQPSNAVKAGDNKVSDSVDSALMATFEPKIKAEWEAIKNKDKKAYGELLADDYQGVGVDGQGERNKVQSIADLSDENVANYTLWGFRVTPAGPDAALVIYESTIQFPPKSVIRYSRLYISELWLKRDGKWKEVHYQETRVK